MSDKNPFEQMMAMGQEWMKSAVDGKSSWLPDGFEQFIPTMPKEMMEAVMGEGASPDGLDAKTRLLLTLDGMVATGAPQETPVKLAVRHPHEVGATGQEIIKTIGQMSAFGGASAMTTAMTVAMAELENNKEADT